MKKEFKDMDINSQEFRDEVVRMHKDAIENPVDMTEINEKFNKSSTISFRVSKYEREKIEEFGQSMCLKNSKLIMMALRELGVDF